jgi:hypothetical protein
MIDPPRYKDYNVNTDKTLQFCKFGIVGIELNPRAQPVGRSAPRREVYRLAGQVYGSG